MKILIIDDNTDITDAIKFYCESKNTDYQIANNASEGLAAINNDKFDLVLLDIAMPEFTGLDVLNNLKSSGLLDKLNIVVFTASSDAKMFEEIKRNGVKEILKKPCSVEELEQVFSRYRKSF